MTEDELQTAVIECAHLFGWRVAHFRPARTAQGWRTPVQADGKGFPDLVLVRGPQLVFAELKGEGAGRPRAEQSLWLDALAEVDETDVYLWRPEAWMSGAVELVLR